MSDGEARPRATELAVGRRWLFGSAVLDERSLELSVHGAPTHIERKPLEVLLYLLHHAGEVVTKDELAENLWPGRILTESVLTRCMSQLRHVLKDEDRAVIRTIHGFGYRLVAEVRVEAAATPAPPKFAFKAGDHPPLRPQWCLVERLGTGGHGEAWLARHEKTQDARVFKFALDAEALASLKREITLYRLLHEALGARAAVVRIFEWNIEEPPCFLETEYVEGRDLQAWADARGGLLGVSMEVRLDLVAQIADALAAAHRVGVLHKDLKPGNVLIEERTGGPPQVKLCDFGSGGVLDPSHLERLGITRLGFTSVAAGAETGGTSLYVAPEVIAGQPFTVSADIYALGTMLYQLVVGDLRKALAPGWELNVTDEMLREDIAAAADGDPALRLADATQLAARLRSLEPRRQARAAEAVARERAERASRALQALRRARLFASVVLVLAVTAIAGSVMAYRARNDAIEARATTQAINDFLMEDMLGVDPALEKPKDASYESLLSRAAGQVDSRFKNQPEAAASIHWLLGRRFQEVGRMDLARMQHEAASALLPRLQGDAAIPALLALDRLVPIYSDHGRLEDAREICRRLVDEWGRRYGRVNLSTLLLRARVARAMAFGGELKNADSEFSAVFADLPRAEPLHIGTKVVLKEWLGVALAADASGLTSSADVMEAVQAYMNSAYGGYLGEFAERYGEALPKYRSALAVMSRLFGEDAEITASIRMSLALTGALAGQQSDVEEQMRQAQGYFDLSLPPAHWLRSTPRLLKGRIAIELQRPDDAIAALESAKTLCDEGACPPRIAEEIRYDLGRAHDQLGRLGSAIALYQSSLAAYEQLRGRRHLGSLKRRISAADALRRADRTLEASTMLSGVTPEALDALPSPHLVVADFKRVQGLLWVEDREVAKGRAALEQSLEIFERQLGGSHGRTKRVRTELMTLLRSTGPNYHQ